MSEEIWGRTVMAPRVRVGGHLETPEQVEARQTREAEARVNRFAERVGALDRSVTPVAGLRDQERFWNPEVSGATTEPLTLTQLRAALERFNS